MILIKSKKKKINNIYLSKNFFFEKILNKNKKLFILDFNIFNIFFKKKINLIKNYNFIVLPFGENIKNINTLKIIWKFMMKKKINKNYLIISIGGGVMNDIVGFICSSYFRGIKYSIFPTTLLSIIDSSIGGKNAVNFFSKNSLGTINYPIFIYINFSIIYYMKKNEFKDGYSEIIKYSLLNKSNFLFYLFKKKNIKKIIIRSCYIKTKIISQDYIELNVRSCLNLGHTYAHCIENNLIKKFSHGKSVSLGIIFSIFISSFYYFFKKKEIIKILNLLIKYNFFVKSKLKFSKIMIKKFLLDKKFDNKINFVFIKKIGYCIQKIIRKKIIINFLKKI